ncbi:hypothetical protein [Maribacter sp. R77961]|uniref:hypothetical protein n=1 Tax=Maribacter sp. R77961 TaxID=3093871 RepID=UPI0037C52CF1
MKDSLNFILGPQGLILLGGILALVGAFWSSRRDLSAEKEINKKNEIIIQKTEEISELNNKIVNVLTGGNSFPVVTFGIPDRIHGTPILSLNGENAIPNVSGSFIDVRELREDQKEGDIASSVGMNFHKNIVSPAYVMFVIDEKTFLDISKGGRYMIHFYTPYNSFTQLLAVEPSGIDGYPLQAYKIYKGDLTDEGLIHTKYPENFPIPLEEIDFLEALTSEDI